MKTFLIFCAALALAGCVTMTGNEVSSSSEPFTIQGRKVDVAALDPEKAKSSDFAALKQVALQKLAQKGMIIVDSRKENPDYLILINYAIDMGDDFKYERRLLVNIYDFNSGRKVQSIKSSWLGDGKGSASTFVKMLQKTIERLPVSPGFQKISAEE